MKNRWLYMGLLGLCAFAGASSMTAIPLRIPGAAKAQTQTAQFESPSAANVAVSLGKVFESVAADVSPSVVSVESSYPARLKNPGKPNDKVIEESGSGFIVNLEGHTGYYILTNNHVIAFSRPEQITIRLADGRLLRPVQVWSDPETDVALLGLSKQIKALPTAELGDSKQVHVGQWVLAFGSPFGLSQSVTHGIISACERGEVSLGSSIRIKNFLQTDAAINPGSSGGPLADMNGKIIGINTAIASHSGSSSGVAFAIPVSLAKQVAHQLLTHGKVARGYLGMQLARSFEPKDALKLGLNKVQGAWVDRVYPETPAAEAGLKSNDVIIQVESVIIKSENHLINLISKLPAGQRIQLRIWRDRQLISLSAVVGDWNKAQSKFQIP